MSEFQPHWFAEYELLRHLGEGGMAEVFLSRFSGARGFEKIAVVKRLLRQNLAEPHLVDLFIREAKLAVHLQHANIVQILRFEEAEGFPFIVMEYVHGRDLQAILNKVVSSKSDLPVDFVIHSIVEMLKGLGHAHEASGPDGELLHLVHRDVTPANIFVSYDGEVKLGDFGVAHSEGQVQAQDLRGKLGYMAPEIVQGEVADARADIFSAGICLWECLAKKRLFTGRFPIEILNRVVNKTPGPPSQFNSAVSPDIDRIVQRALAKDPDERFQSALQFEEALSDFMFVRRMRWTRRRIAEVMKALFPDESSPLVVPPPLARPRAKPVRSQEQDAVVATSRMMQALDGVESIPLELGKSQQGWTDSLESSIVDSAAQDRTPPRKTVETVVQRLLVYECDSENALLLGMQEFVDKLLGDTRSVAAVGVSGDWRVDLEHLCGLLFWEALLGPLFIGGRVIAENTFDRVSLTRILYEATARKMNGLIVLEDGLSSAQRTIFMEAGRPTYISTSDPEEGVLPTILKHHLLDSELLFRGLSKSVEEFLPLDRALAEVQADKPEVSIGRLFSAILRSRLYEPFKWSTGRFKLLTDSETSMRVSSPMPPLLGVLIRGVRRAFAAEDLMTSLKTYSNKKIRIKPERRGHIQALLTKPEDHKTIEAIDGSRNVSQIVMGATGEADTFALSLLYVLLETGIAEAVEG